MFLNILANNNFIDYRLSIKKDLGEQMINKDKGNKYQKLKNLIKNRKEEYERTKVSKI